MPDYGWLALYCVLVLIFSCLGGYVPFLGKVPHSRLQLYLSASAGVMLGAAFFHVMPDAMEKAPAHFGWWMALGTVGLFCIERFIAPHSHEVDGGHAHHHEHHHEHTHHKQEEVLGYAPQHDHGHTPHEHHSEQRAAAPAVAGWMAVVGLTIHTFMNGFGLAGSVDAGLHPDASSLHPAITLFPGFALFLAIILHKPADALAISTVLTRKGISRRKIMLVQVGFAATVGIGAAAFLLAHDFISDSLRGELTGAALAFSAGTFLFIALSDLLPEVQFHKHDRVPLFLALVTGVVFMGLIALLEDHDEGDKKADAGKPAAGKPEE